MLKDGASSIYGSDAVAGVVNFIMWNDTHDNGPLFEGAEFEIRYGNTTDHDANVRAGVDSWRGHRFRGQGRDIRLG